MTLGYPDEILPYPAVEYIPLDIDTKLFKTNLNNKHKTKLYIFNNPNDATNILNNFNINYNLNNISFSNNLLILLIGLKAEDIYYRGYNVQIIGNPIPNSCHLFTITNKYFYKDKLVFNFFTSDGEKIISESYQL
ncbi:hypothetical protein [Orenia marismortui]|uniref:hypothetical protein n=1 Tax=Orenia marismortui TaxID=46469 RepID=UPI000374F3FF|nr:hypothetical protein [Orenia marismortui]